MSVVAIVQARVGSTRMPGKVLKKINGVPLIELLLRRLSGSQAIDKIVLATTLSASDDTLAEYVSRIGYHVFRGSENDVLDRYFNAAIEAGATTIVRITGDCPLVSPDLVDEVVNHFLQSGADYCSNTIPPTYPDGMDIEVFSFDALERASREAELAFDREHVTPYLKDQTRFNHALVRNETDFSNLRWTVDEEEDFSVIKSVYDYFKPDIFFRWRSVLELENIKPEIFMKNKSIRRDEGANLGTGQKLWKRAKKIIPGGNMLLSKRAEMFLPDFWPSYFSKAKGCQIWDLDGKRFIDMSLMGVGTNTLGYGNDEVDSAVLRSIADGNMSTLNCPEEVALAERLVGLHPWSEMVRFARTGGEANAIAVRIARAASGRDKVAICGYHGWHDWYLAANLGDQDTLFGHLLPGLQPNGVPRDLRGTIFPFRYNQLNELEKIVREHDIGAIIMEVSRNEIPANNFLTEVRSLATQKNIVLVFDECTSGFRQSLGGLHKIYGVEPDLAIFGKALGNGYAMTAVIGRRAIMEVAQSSFISSTFWTERVGPAASLKVLEVMERTRSYELITKIGIDIRAQLETLSVKYGLGLTITGLPSLTTFGFSGPSALKYKTLLTQEMLSRGFLASTSIYVCTEHTADIVGSYFDALEPVLSLISECQAGRDIDALLSGPICHGGFKRIN